jgi:2-dehydropantoate 2-reductase
MDIMSRICIIGPGAIGGVVAAVLTQKGYNPQLVVKYPELAQKINSKGIEVEGTCGNFTIQVPSVARPDELSGTFDYVLIATRAYGLVDAAREVLPFLHENSRVVSMQNGICGDMLAEVVGNHRTVGCVVGFGGTMHEPGRVEMTSGGELVIGNWNREPDQELKQLAVILNHVVETRITNEIFQDLYSKLIINSCITTLGVICGQLLGKMLAERKARNLFIEIIREAVAVADAMEIEVPPGAAGKLDYYKFLAPGPLSGLRQHLTIRVIGMKYRKLKSSSLQSLKRGRKTEVYNYNGYISARGKELGVSTPVNEKLTHMVGEIEEGKRKITPENFDEFFMN